MRPDQNGANWFSPTAGKNESSRIRRALDFWLGRLGPTWRASPLRRVAQTGCLAIFLYLIFYVSWPYAEVFDQGVIARKEWLPVESFLWIDPLVGLSTAIAARCINPALMVGAVFVAMACLAVPRVFCGYLCPQASIRFATRFGSGEAVAAGDRSAMEPETSRRGFVISVLSGTATALAIPRIGPTKNRPTKTSPGDPSSDATAPAPPWRPPGSVPEAEFLDLCIRCGLCFQVCPGPVLHRADSSGGLDALWTPVAVPSHAGCHQDCNHCTQICPTGAIRPLSIHQKRKTRMGLAKIDTEHCLAHAGEAECRLCLEECTASGYNAIRMEEIRLELTDVPEGIFSEMELDAMSRIEAPVVDRDACVGCGLCEYRCNAVLVKRDKELHQPAVVVEPC